ncbi:hypothetical protein KAT92_05490, partial [Candidatus Babeliales bacterium]|nr:hypothetical protein [Candidatus Babeliales bacterium]
ELNLGRLSPINFSPVSDYTSRPLSQIEAACYAEVLGWFKMAKDQAVAQNENNCFDRLFVKK